MAFASITTDTATPKLLSLMREMAPPQQMRTLLQWGALVKAEAQRTAIGKGGRKFWREIARSVNIRSAAEAVYVESNHYAAAQMQYGGDISAPGKNSESPAKALTIPIKGSPAEGRRASEFSQKLFTLKSAGSGDAEYIGVLGYNEGTGKDARFVPLFILRKRVRGHKSPWWPTDARAAQIGEALADKLIARAAQ